MQFEEIKQLLAQLGGILSLLDKIAGAIEEGNRINADWIEHIKTRDEKSLEQAKEINSQLLTFLSDRQLKMMQTIDLLCERTGVNTPEWYDGQNQINAELERIRNEAE